MLVDKKSKMRVLLVYHYVAKYREPIFRELAETGNFNVAADTQSNNDIEIVSPDFYQPSFFIKLQNVWFGRSFLWQMGLLKQVFSRKYDAVVFLGDPFFLSTWVSVVFIKLMKKRSVLWTHGFIRNGGTKDQIKLFLYRIVDALFLYGDHAKENLIQYGISKDKLYPIYNSLDYLEQKKLRDSVNADRVKQIRANLFEEDHFQIVFVGRLTHHKKLNVLIELLVELEKRGVIANLLLIGDGAARTELENLVCSFKGLKSRVNFYGKTYEEEELCCLLMSSDLCVAPGEIGLTAMHVMAYGIPVVTHDDLNSQMPEYESVIEGLTGRLYSHGVFDSLVEVVENCIQNPIVNVRSNCISLIEAKYSPVAQKRLILKALGEILE